MNRYRYIAVLVLFQLSAQAGDRTVMHCFAWTPVKTATPADWQAFYTASDALPRKIQGMVPVTRVAREYGMCMEMKDTATLKAYETDPYHEVWTEAYSKVRVEGTTTFNVLGQ